ncbi:DUF835 domain-containing protein [Thermococcus sp. M36]|uniref:DUF835 domain-containing protein n=1 Tax=Thermococcus sp. M36 TaxID=1638261 RepID=UPI0031843527
MVYKAHQTREKGWALLSAAMFINALDIESYLFDPLGIHIADEVYPLASKIPNFFIATLIIWGTLHIKYRTTHLRHVVYLSVFLVASYTWLFLLAADAFGGNHSVEAVFPSLAYGGSLIYLGMILREYEIRDHGLDMLFPWGLILLGALNITYPVTRYIKWFIPIGFLLGAIFRSIAAVGALKFVFVPFPRIKTQSGTSKAPSGAFICYKPDDVSKRIGKLEDISNLVVITRKDMRALKDGLHPDSLVFWVTRVLEGEINEKPSIYAISPTKIDILVDLVIRAVDRGYSIIYIDAVEYLILENGFERAFKFLINLKDRVLMENGTMVLLVDPEALEHTHRKILEREFQRG